MESLPDYRVDRAPKVFFDAGLMQGGFSSSLSPPAAAAACAQAKLLKLMILVHNCLARSPFPQIFAAPVRMNPQTLDKATYDGRHVPIELGKVSIGIEVAHALACARGLKIE